MEQRPLRLGDIVDDYCPRERRVTNHAVVAIVDDAIRQTRCTTCDAEHVFKGGQEPRRRLRPGTSAPQSPAVTVSPEESQLIAGEAVAPEPAVSAPVDSPAPDESGLADLAARDNQSEGSLPETWWSHRRLIRATLPKTDGELPPPRPIPEFTMHQRPSSRPARPFRFDHNGRGDGGAHAHGRSFNGNGNRGDGDDEINGNVAGPPNGRGPTGNGHAPHPAGRRRRGRRRRGR